MSSPLSHAGGGNGQFCSFIVSEFGQRGEGTLGKGLRSMVSKLYDVFFFTKRKVSAQLQLDRCH